MLRGGSRLYAVAPRRRGRPAEAPDALVVLGLPPGGSPARPTLHQVLAAVAVTAFGRAVGQWSVASGGDPAEAVAVDGTTRRGRPGAVAAPGPGLPGAAAAARVPALRRAHWGSTPKLHDVGDGALVATAGCQGINDPDLRAYPRRESLSKHIEVTRS
jgi:hypothetical protein